MHIGFNKYQVYGKIIVLILFWGFISLFLFFLPGIKFDLEFTSATIGKATVIILIFGLLFFLSCLMTLQLIFLPKGVDIDKEKKTITLDYFFSRAIVININEVTNYSSTLIKSGKYGQNRFEGVLVNVNDRCKYLLSDFNLNHYSPVLNFLEESNVTFIGHEKISMILYFRDLFKSHTRA